MRFFGVLALGMFVALILQHFLGPVPMMHARVMLMPVIFFYGALALPVWGMLALSLLGGLMWDALNTQFVEGVPEIAAGWSIVLYALLGGIMNGFRPLFQRGRWEVHCLMTGVCTSLLVLGEYFMLTIRRQPVQFIFPKEVWWRIGGAGLIAVLLSPVLFFVLNYLAALCGYDTQPMRRGARR